MTFRLDERGRPALRCGVPRACRSPPATLGLEFAGSGPLREGLKVVGTRRRSRDETYAIPVGKASSARDHHHELIVSLEEAAPPRRQLDLAFRAFDDGVAFRYLIPSQEPLAEFVLTDELTRLRFPGDPTARALPLDGYTTSYESVLRDACRLGDRAGSADRPADAAGRRRAATRAGPGSP